MARIGLLTFCLLFAFSVVPFAVAKDNLQITEGPKVEHVDGNSAVIAWSTNTSASTVVKYGTEPDKLDQSAKMPWGGITHRVTLKNLQPNATYYFQAISGDGQGTGTSAESAVSQFQTIGGPRASSTDDKSKQPDHAEIIAGPIPQSVTAESVDIYWKTDRPSEATVKYGASQNALNQTAQQANAGGQTHRVGLKKLQSGTTYYFVIEGADGKVQGSGQFRTLTGNEQKANAVEITDGPNIDHLSSNAVKISWSTNVGSGSVVKYGTDPHLFNLIAHAPWGETNHSLTLANLNPNTKYYFQIGAGQGEETEAAASSNVYSFQTVQNGQSAVRDGDEALRSRQAE